MSSPQTTRIFGLLGCCARVGVASAAVNIIRKSAMSGGTRSDVGRDCRDAFLGLAKTCAKLGIAFWDYLGAKLAVPDQPAIPYLPGLVSIRCAPP